MARAWLAQVARRAGAAAEGFGGGRGSCGHRSISSGTPGGATPSGGAPSGGAASGVGGGGSSSAGWLPQQVQPAALGSLAQLHQQQQQLQQAQAARRILGDPVVLPRGTLLITYAALLGGGVFLGAHSDWLVRQAEPLLPSSSGSAAAAAATGSSDSSSSSNSGAAEAVASQQQHKWLADYLPSFMSHSQARGGAAAASTAAEPRGGSNSALSGSIAGGAPLGGCLSAFFISDAAAKAAPAVVNITVQASGALPVGSSGSGFIVDPDGTILTNAHVVSDAIQRHYYGGGGSSSSGGAGSSGAAGGGNAGLGASSSGISKGITVTLQDGRIFDGRLVSFDTVSDLAVLKVESDAPLPTAKLGRSASLRVGEWVVALGSPLHLQNSVTAGIVSCVDRKAVELGLAGARTDYIQTDAAINKGNSGGPLVNLYGEVVGISAMKAVAADGVSFAIPVDAAVDVMRQLKEHGRVIRPYVGIKMLQLNKHNVAQFRRRDPNFPRVESGILVPGVHPGSPAERAGLRPGDCIIGFGDRTRDVTTTALIRALGEHIGRPLTLRVARPGDKIEVLNVVAQEAGDGGMH